MSFDPSDYNGAPTGHQEFEASQRKARTCQHDMRGGEACGETEGYCRPCKDPLCRKPVCELHSIDGFCLPHAALEMDADELIEAEERLAA